MKQATADRSAKARRKAKRVWDRDFRKLRTIPILKRGEPWITSDEAVRRARANPTTNHGKRFAMKLADDLNAGRVSCKNWRLWQYVIFGKGSQRYGGNSYAWCVIRHRGGFYCYYCRYYYFTDDVHSYGRLLRSRK